MKVLLVDDEKNVIDVMKILGKWKTYGITTILEANCGKEAKNIIEKERPEIIFTDIKMPGINGLELMTWLDTISYHGKVIFVTGYHDYSYMRQAIKHNSFDYLLKPIEADLFNQILQEAVEAWKQDYLNSNITEDKYAYNKVVTDACLGETFDIHALSSSLPEAEQYEVTLLSFYHTHYADPVIDTLANKLYTQRLGNAYSLLIDYNICLVLTLENEWFTVEKWLSEQIECSIRIVTSKKPQPLTRLPETFSILQRKMHDNQYRHIQQAAQLEQLNRMQDIISYVNDYYMEDISLETLSNLFFLSREHISRKFKQETGLPLSKYVTKLRIDQAKYWLVETEETIYSIALMLGYQDENFFSKLFKKMTGSTPSEYRKATER
ncbi:response regulator [Gracilibacillus sp. S3-1-1]|uniref:Response regulator n=1 Tax=Gracilibacillus pellucidus TaxID=3095368 RepID=A0ACC6M9P7_9BACI|nr:helix-turn-helix domain-containing protein [Gracilibacillus sp. S3-1-1]MDX8047561.1 response regulator [Gracilibacillus sp. S3-1-1]